MTGFAIRLYKDADFDACIAIFLSNCPDYCGYEERSDFEHWLRHIQGNYYVIENAEGKVIGCGGYAVRGQEADFCWGLIHRSLHLRKLGTLLVEHRLHEIRKDPNITSVHLDTSQHTYRFFERFGFVTKKITEQYYSPKLDRYDMRLELT